MEKLKKQKYKIEKNGGITLIALVITIIVILILAAISITMLTGDNSILKRAVEAKDDTIVGQEKEQIEIAYISVAMGNLEDSVTVAKLQAEMDKVADTTVSDNADGTLNVYYNDTTHEYTINNGKVSVKGPSITDVIKIGDYVDYDPTKSNVNKTENIEESKLTYTSPTGTGQSHGNGYSSTEENGGQKYTVKSNIKWRVLNVTNDKVEIIPNTTIKKDAESQNDGNFVLSGPIGYLYAEQELNEICKIYGYGYGANTNQVTSFSIGGPYPGEETTKTITGSGARSININDINKLAKIGEKKDEINVINSYTDIDSNYGNTKEPKSNIYYPTITTRNGKSASAGVKELKYTYYKYDKSIIPDMNILDSIFNEDCWLASRCIYTSLKTNTISANFRIFAIYSNNTVGGINPAGAWYTNRFSPTTIQVAYGIKPVVTLIPGCIDISNFEENSGTEENSWKLK